jgi:protein-L-isoaspartate(D-aspartate) O-methyltransferase
MTIVDLATCGQRFAAEIAKKSDVSDPRIAEAFQRVRRESFLGKGPWCISESGDMSPSSDPEYVYQDIVIAISPNQGITNGLPSLHARCISALAPSEGESVIHIGAGTGYYTAVLSELVGPEGNVSAFEIDEPLAERAKTNLRPWPNVRVSSKSGVTAELERADAIYVCAGVSLPPRHWFEVLRVGGRLVLPLVSRRSAGAMWLVNRHDSGFQATYLCHARFYPCIGAQVEDLELNKAYANGNPQAVRSLRFDAPQDDSSWHVGDGWWLSRSAVVD